MKGGAKVKKTISIGLLLVFIFAVTGCNNSIPPPTGERLQSDTQAAGAAISEADFTNQNGYTATVKSLDIQMRNYEILETIEEGQQVILNGIATGNNNDWQATAAYTAVYEKEGKELQFVSIEFEDAAITPTVLLDFTGGGLAMLPLFESANFKYKTLDDIDGFATGKAVVNAETIERIVAVYIPIEDDMTEKFIYYSIKIYFTNGMTLEGATAFDYLPSNGTAGIEGVAKWKAIKAEDYTERG